MRPGSIACWRVFQSTPMREGERGDTVRSRASNSFQSTPMREGERPTWAGLPDYNPFQSTPMREGEPPSRGARHSGSRFNPRPCVRANEYKETLFWALWAFQSTPMREGERPPTPSWWTRSVSIHAHA